MIAAVMFFFFVLFAGPTLMAISGMWTGITHYVTELIPLSAPFGREDDAYRQDWSVFYWAWWVSWAPFVGMFVARVSKGRTVREFLLCVLIVPSLFIFMWMGVFGSIALDQLYTNPAASLVKEYVIDSYRPELALFGMLNELPLTGLMSSLGDHSCAHLLRDVIGFRLSGDRYHHRRRQDRSASASAYVLGDGRGVDRHRVTDRWWVVGASSGCHGDGYPIFHLDAADVLLHHPSAERRAAPHAQRKVT